jgi:hypothetical protein
MTRDAQHAPSRGGPAEQHLAASLELFERLAKERGPVSGYAALRALLAEGPAAATSRDLTLKYDFYLGRQQGGAWGLTINDAHEGAAHARDVLRFARALGQGYRLGALQTLAQRVREADVSLTFAVGFDAPDRPARLKFYFQERTWNAGVLRWAGLTPLLAELVPGFELPRFVAPTRSVGVVAIDLTPAGGVAAKVYLGHSNLAELCAGAPTEVGALADDMARVCPMPGQFYYLTVRARSGEAPSYSINKIYDVAALVNAERSEEAWLDASGLFDLTGDRTAFDRLRAMTHGLLAIPTATALDQRDRERDRDCSQSADLYVAAIRPD